MSAYSPKKLDHRSLDIANKPQSHLPTMPSKGTLS